jgi:hypothetical protein
MCRPRTWILVLPFLLAFRVLAQEPVAPPTPLQLFTATIDRIANFVVPPEGATAQTFSASIEIVRANGLPKELLGKTIEIAYQAPDRLLLKTEHDGHTYSVGRDQEELWFHTEAKNFGVVGRPDAPRFLSNPSSSNAQGLVAFELPLPKQHLAMLPLAMEITNGPTETLDDVVCTVLEATTRPEARAAFRLLNNTVKLAIRNSDGWPARVSYSDGRKLSVELRVRSALLGPAWSDDRWKIPARSDDRIEITAVSHLSRAVAALLSSFDNHVPTLGPATGKRVVIATEGEGRLEIIDGTRVLFTKGSPHEMGRQHGFLLRKQIDDVVERILYGVGVGSSLTKGRWFFGEIEQAQARLAPFINPRYLTEMDAIAITVGRSKEEIRLANFFPELFHCSGFAIFGDATEGGRMFHGRVLDYLKGVGLEQNAVVMVMQPDEGHAWVNVSYAGFVGSVTGMNEKQIAIGEMGGRGEGNWDGKPMAQLIREVMENADTLDEAIQIMRDSPRTCEYYYVISDAKSKRAVGIAATPTRFELVWPGESHPELRHPIPDAVLMSAGDRYSKLVERVKAGYGKFTAATARDLMCVPVAMKSNIHSVLFAPDTLDFWVANADSANPASHTRYTHYNLRELLTSP